MYIRTKDGWKMLWSVPATPVHLVDGVRTHDGKWWHYPLGDTAEWNKLFMDKDGTDKRITGRYYHIVREEVAAAYEAKKLSRAA